MPDLLDQGSNWLDGKRHQHMTRTMTYMRGDDSVEIAATIGRSEFEQTDEYGVVQQVQSRDFLVRTNDLVLANKRALPKAGDQIREVDSEGVVFVYEVMSPSNGDEPPFRYSDPYRKTLRIHTKHIATEPDA